MIIYLLSHIYCSTVLNLFIVYYHNSFSYVDN